MEQATSDDSARIKIIDARIKAIRNGQLVDEADEGDIEGLQGEADELKANIAARNKKIAGFKESRSWNIDNICRVKDEKSIISNGTSTSLKADDFTPNGLTGTPHPFCPHF